MLRIWPLLLGFCATVFAFAASASAQPHVYALVSGGASEQGGLYQIPLTPRIATVDTATGQVVSSTPLTGCVAPGGFDLTPDGARVYVACQGTPSTGGLLMEVDPSRRLIVRTKAFATQPRFVAITPDGTRALVSQAAGDLAIVDLASLSTATTVPVAFPGRIAVLPAGTRAYVPSTTLVNGPGSVAVINLVSGTVLRTIAVEAAAADAALSGDGTTLVVWTVNGRVSIVDTATDAVSGTIDVKGYSNTAVPGLGQIAVDRAGTRAYVPMTLPTSDPSAPVGIRVVDLATRTLVGTIALKDAGVAIALSAAGDRLHATTGFSAPPGSVTTIDPATNAVTTAALVVGSIVQIRGVPPAILPPADPCGYALSFAVPTSSSVQQRPTTHPAGSTGRLAVVALPDACTWTPQTDASWIAFDASGGTGTKTIGYTIAPNTTGQSRSGTVTIGGQSLTMTQAGCSNPVILMERPRNGQIVSQPYTVSGWAIDTCAVSGTGMTGTTTPGSFTYGSARQDVAGTYGQQFLNSGFTSIRTPEVPAGPVHLTVSFLDAVTGDVISTNVDFTVTATGAPFGSLDTPVNGTTASGELGVTGWALDDVEIGGPIQIYRSALPGEPTSPNAGARVFVGTASRVAGARPDVAAAFPGFPDNDRAGFGLMVLTNMLPNGGNGTFSFTADVVDRVSNRTTLGPKTVTLNNSGSMLPFGTIDTPAQGETVSGIVTNFGWALAPAMIPTDGSTIDVVIDNIVVGHPVYNQARSDISSLFPSYVNSSGPVGYYIFDSRNLANGVHTIAWVIRDSAGNTTAVGSRYFTVANP